MAEYLDPIIKVTKSFLIGLFAYLDCEKLPTTNNDLEIFHRQVKTRHRRRTGRRSSHDYLIRYGRFVVYQMGSNCTERIPHFPYSQFKASLSCVCFLYNVGRHTDRGTLHVRGEWLTKFRDQAHRFGSTMPRRRQRLQGIILSP